MKRMQIFNKKNKEKKSNNLIEVKYMKWREVYKLKCHKNSNQIKYKVPKERNGIEKK